MGRLIAAAPELLWIIPLADVTIFSACGLLLATTGRWWTQLLVDRSGVWLPAFLVHLAFVSPFFFQLDLTTC